MKKRLLSLLMAIFMVLSTAPMATVFASEAHSHEGWTAISSEADLRTLFTYGGSGYLTQDVTLDASILEEKEIVIENVSYTVKDRPELSVAKGKTVNLCLDGHTLDLNGSAPEESSDARYYKFYHDSNITCLTGSTLSLYDCAETGKIINGYNAEYDGGAIFLDGASLYMYGGTISNCKAKFGGAISCGLGEFHMYGGTISENEAFKYGGGVFEYYNANESADSHSFHMLGGTITNNKAGTAGGGIFSSDNVSFSGKCIVYGNSLTGSDAASNLYVTQPISIEDGHSAAYENRLIPGSKIGVSMGTLGAFTKDGGTSTDYLLSLPYFTADREDQFVCFPGDGNYLALNSNSNKTISAVSSSGGAIYISDMGAKEGDKVTILTAPEEGHHIASIVVKDGNNEPVAVNGNTFTMPQGTASVAVTYTDKYKINIVQSSGGSITASPSAAAAGETVTLTVTTEAGFALAALDVDGAAGAVTISNNSFTMPASDVNVSALFYIKQGRKPRSLFSFLDECR